MVQLDNLILVSQLQFLLFFFLGYFFFLKKVLPIISMELKFREKILLSHMRWFSNNLNNIIFYKHSYFSLLVKFRSLLYFFNIFTKKKNIFFGIYDIDLLSIKFQYLNRKK